MGWPLNAIRLLHRGCSVRTAQMISPYVLEVRDHSLAVSVEVEADIVVGRLVQSERLFLYLLAIPLVESESLSKDNDPKKILTGITSRSK